MFVEGIAEEKIVVATYSFYWSEQRAEFFEVKIKEEIEVFVYELVFIEKNLVLIEIESACFPVWRLEIR